MSIVNLNVTRNEGGDITGVTNVATRTGFEHATDIVLMPTKLMAGDDEMVQAKTAGRAAFAWGVGGFLFGEAFGNARGRDGKKSFLPVFRQSPKQVSRRN